MREFIVTSILIILSGCAFKSPMIASPTGDGKYWVLQEQLEYIHPKTNQLYVVPRGFVTDLASVPRLFWAAFPPCGQYTTAAVLHDYLYWVQSNECDRECADEILLIAMAEADVDLVSRNAIYTAVRAGGSSSWNENARLKESGIIRVIPEQYMDFGTYDSWDQIQDRIRG